MASTRRKDGPLGPVADGFRVRLMALLHAGVDSAVIALWLGHADVRSTQAYLHADLTIKERALARTTPPGGKAGRYRPPDTLIAFLEGL